MIHKIIGIGKFVLVLMVLLLLISACGDVTSTPPNPFPTPPQPTPYPETLVTFRVTLPDPLQPGDSLLLTILDEVSGLAINASQHIMEAEDSVHYSIILPFSIGSVVKYRYTRQGSFLAQEHLSDGRPVRYRLYYVSGQGVTDDVVTRWTDTKSTQSTGRINGRITEADTGEPIPNILVAAGGAQALTLSDGTYLLEGMIPGIHNLTVYALDGNYQTYQQGAKVLADSTTPANISLEIAQLVNVTFTVILPRETPFGAPVRFVGNLNQLGNTFADLAGGVSTLATRAPVLSPMPDGRYSITMTLPAGADIRYKYSLGDGIWNAERSLDGDFRIRQLIVPNEDSQVYELVDSWRSGQFAPITFETTVPSNTPQNEFVSVQFNPGYGWLEPVPMWPLESSLNEKRWRYTLYSPLDITNTFRYRYCRTNLCGSADDAATVGSNPVGRTVNTNLLSQTIVDEVNEWAWLPGNVEPATIPNIEIHTRGSDFIAGIAYEDLYHPSWDARIADSIMDVKSSHANWLVLRPSWTFTRISPPVLELVPSQDILYYENANMIINTRNQGLKAALFPSIKYNQNSDVWWESASLDFSWWVVWFERYEKFILHHADLAARYGAEALILGGDEVLPALPHGVLADGSSSNVPEDAEARWFELLQEIRQRFKGAVLWAYPFQGTLDEPPSFLSAIDGIYLLWSAPLASSPDADYEALLSEAGNVLDNTILPFQERISKPIIIAASYPSADGGITGCIRDPIGDCIPFGNLYPPYQDMNQIKLDLNEQSDVYNALLAAINDREWVSGFVSDGYYPPVPLLDKSISIHGKPASGVLWFWFPNMLGE